MKKRLTKKKLYISLGAIAAVTVPLVITSCSFTNNIRYQLFNFAKRRIIDLVGEVENYFKDDLDPDITEFKVKLKSLVEEMKNTAINADNPPEKFINHYENEANNLFNLYAQLKQQKVQAIIDLYVSKAKASTLLNAIGLLPNFKEEAKKLNNVQNQIPPVDISTPKANILEYIEISNASLNTAKSAIKALAAKYEIQNIDEILKLV
ncbi:hypothetical protein HGG64_00155 [Mycoplasma phocoeninasale]|uniref:Lipoprotein n=1 Tax=Mycoplasma phocoeninasale TaxID=2726117 RepID=A0A858U424_9MOLU|nr:hypothetical protein [Mycoplasma phocoeninasale]QJG66147.1 hypothetical protein HGG64_00155 [Mycoplasma phocoeninasale]